MGGVLIGTLARTFAQRIFKSKCGLLDAHLLLEPVNELYATRHRCVRKLDSLVTRPV